MIGVSARSAPKTSPDRRDGRPAEYGLSRFRRVALTLFLPRWALEDSNLRPQPCEGCALTN
jgi:hypothetical protein